MDEKRLLHHADALYEYFEHARDAGDMNDDDYDEWQNKIDQIRNYFIKKVYP